MTPDDLSTWRQVGQWIWAVVSALIAVVWASLNNRISKAEAKADAAVSKAEFDRAHDDLRGDIKELFAKADSVKDLMHAQIAGVEQRLSGELDRNRADMNGAFNRMQDLIEKKLGREPRN